VERWVEVCRTCEPGCLQLFWRALDNLPPVVVVLVASGELIRDHRQAPFHCFSALTMGNKVPALTAVGPGRMPTQGFARDASGTTDNPHSSFPTE